MTRAGRWPVALGLLCLAGAASVAWGAGPAGSEAASGPPTLAYYLGEVSGESVAPDYDPEIPEPRSVLGWQVGEWHVRHDQLARYFEVLAEASDRVTLERIGETHERRPLLHATISAPENLARLDAVRTAHQELTLGEDGAAGVDLADLPALVNLGYSVHGNEASGSNASLLVAYHLAAARDEATLGLLQDLVIIIDPSLNPDGLSRFATWANMHRGRVVVADPQHREHVEGWPNGRTNHYWFDLNRDWLLAQHPETRARLTAFHRWMPHVLADFHEMGSDSTYFFQPGVPERKNPLTPERNVELTQAFARRHAEALDALGSLYYTEESFDDFYYGKGSTYPDVHGAVGILFEQASARGHAQESAQAAGGQFTFPFAIRNQVATSFSTLRAARELRPELLEYRREFFAESRRLARSEGPEAWVVGDSADPGRTARFAELLAVHGVRMHRLAEPAGGAGGGSVFEPGAALVIPADQPQYRLLRALFDTSLEFEDTTFYDVSTWTLPLAFDLPVGTVGLAKAGKLLESAEVHAHLIGDAPVRSSAETVAWAFEWRHYFAARTLRQLQDAGVRARVSLEPFTATGVEGPRTFDRGTVVIPRGLQILEPSELRELLGEAARDGVEMLPLTSGLTPDGIDLGSPNFRTLEKPRPALLVGGGVATYEAGEAWHLLDHRFGVETTLLERHRLGGVDLDRYTHLILVDGRWGQAPENEVRELRRWLAAGGVLIAVKEAAQWAERTFFAKPEVQKHAEPKQKTDEAVERRPYGEAVQDAALGLIGGAIFEVDLDLTHPLAFGYPRDRLPVFRNSRSKLEPPRDPYVTVAAYGESPRLSGYASDKNIDRLAGTPAVIARKVGRGTVVQMADNPNFRAFWYGTNRLFLNALFFGAVVDETGGDRRRFSH